MRPEIVLDGIPLTTEAALAALEAQFGEAKGIKLWQKAVCVNLIGWAGMRRHVSRQTLLRWRRELIAAGVLNDSANNAEFLRLGVS